MVHRSNPERGYAAPLFAGVFILLLIIVSLILNVLQYYRAKARIESRAYQIAAYGGTFLPNPKEAFEHSYNMWRVLRYNLVTGLRAGVNQEIKIWFTSAKGDRTTLEDFDTLPLPDTAPSEWTDKWIGSESKSPVELPIKSMTVQLKEKVPFRFLNLGSFSGGDALVAMTVAAESTTHMVPTDIVMVVENSNSLIAPFFDPAPKLPLGFELPGWNDASQMIPKGCNPLPPPAGDGPEKCKSKATRYTEQCFGRAAYEFKKGAVALYDLLASVGTYRVGVVHTMMAGEEQAHIAVPLGTHPYFRSWDKVGDEKGKNLTNINYGDPSECMAGKIHDCGYGIDVDPNAGAEDNGGDLRALHPVMLEQPHLIPDHPSTRCARITEELPYTVPKHPLEGIFDGGMNDEILENLTIYPPYPPGKPLLPPIHPVTYKQVGSPHLRFCPGYDIPSSGAVGPSTTALVGCKTPSAISAPIHLLPREIIWMKNSGYSSALGMPISNRTYGSPQFGVLRAIDMLENARERRDGLPVRRKIVIVLIDGVDKASLPQLKQLEYPFEPMVIVNDLSSLSVGGTPIKFASKDLGASFCDKPLRPGLDDPNNPYNIEARSTVQPADSEDSNIDGLKLYAFVFGHVGPTQFPQDNFQSGLRSHDFVSAAGKTEVADYRKVCLADASGEITSNSLRRGRAWIESNPAGGGKPEDYSMLYAPILARSILVSENVN